MKNRHLHEVLPWYINGSLSAEEHDEVEQSLVSDDELKKEQEFLSALRHHVKKESCDSPGEFGLQRLRREIKKESKSKASTKWRVFSIAASLLLVVQLGVMLNLTQQDNAFVPLSGEDHSGNVFQIQFQSTATVSHINKFLLDIGAVIVDGPSKNEVYRIRLQTVNDETLQEIRKQKDIVDFVAEE